MVSMAHQIQIFKYAPSAVRDDKTSNIIRYILIQKNLAPQQYKLLAPSALSPSPTHARELE